METPVRGTFNGWYPIEDTCDVPLSRREIDYLARTIGGMDLNFVEDDDAIEINDALLDKLSKAKWWDSDELVEEIAHTKGNCE